MSSESSESSESEVWKYACWVLIRSGYDETSIELYKSFDDAAIVLKKVVDASKVLADEPHPRITRYEECELDINCELPHKSGDLLIYIQDRSSYYFSNAQPWVVYKKKGNQVNVIGIYDKELDVINRIAFIAEYETFSNYQITKNGLIYLDKQTSDGEYVSAKLCEIK